MLNAWKRLVPQLQMEAESPAVEARSLNRGTPRGVPETEFLRENLHGTFIFLGSKITTNDDCSHEINIEVRNLSRYEGQLRNVN